MTVKISTGTAASLKLVSALAKFSLLPCTSGMWSQTWDMLCVCADVGSQVCMVAKTPEADSKASRFRPGQGIPNQMLLSAQPRASHRAANSTVFCDSGKDQLPLSALINLKYCLLTKHFLSGIVTDVKNYVSFLEINNLSASPPCFELLRDHRNNGRIEVCLQVWCWNLQWNQLFLNNCKNLLCQNVIICR